MPCSSVSQRKSAVMDLHNSPSLVVTRHPLYGVFPPFILALPIPISGLRTYWWNHWPLREWFHCQFLHPEEPWCFRGWDASMASSFQGVEPPKILISKLKDVLHCPSNVHLRFRSHWCCIPEPFIYWGLGEFPTLYWLRCHANYLLDYGMGNCRVFRPNDYRRYLYVYILFSHFPFSSMNNQCFFPRRRVCQWLLPAPPRWNFSSNQPRPYTWWFRCRIFPSPLGDEERCTSDIWLWSCDCCWPLCLAHSSFATEGKKSEREIFHVEKLEGDDWFSMALLYVRDDMEGTPDDLFKRILL